MKLFGFTLWSESVDDALRAFTKVTQSLAEIAERETQNAADYRALAKDYDLLARVANAEVLRANKIAAKIETLLSSD